jgi:hypothetical protein
MVGQFRAIAQIQFLADAVAVSLDGLDAQVQALGAPARSARSA